MGLRYTYQVRYPHQLMHTDDTCSHYSELSTMQSSVRNTVDPSNTDTNETRNYSGNFLRQTPLGPTKLSIIERVSSGQGFIIHYVGYIWDSVSVHYRKGSTEVS